MLHTWGKWRSESEGVSWVVRSEGFFFFFIFYGAEQSLRSFNRPSHIWQQSQQLDEKHLDAGVSRGHHSHQGGPEFTEHVKQFLGSSVNCLLIIWRTCFFTVLWRTSLADILQFGGCCSKFFSSILLHFSDAIKSFYTNNTFRLSTNYNITFFFIS